MSHADQWNTEFCNPAAKEAVAPHFFRVTHTQPRDGAQLLYLSFVFVATELRHDLVKRHCRSEEPPSSRGPRITAKFLAADAAAGGRCRHRDGSATVDVRRRGKRGGQERHSPLQR